MSVCVCMRAYVCVCVCAYACTCVRTLAHVRVHVRPCVSICDLRISSNTPTQPTSAQLTWERRGVICLFSGVQIRLYLSTATTIRIIPDAIVQNMLTVRNTCHTGSRSSSKVKVKRNGVGGFSLNGGRPVGMRSRGFALGNVCVRETLSSSSSSSAFPAVSLGFTILLLLRSQLYLWGSSFFFFCVPSYISGVHHSG